MKKRAKSTKETRAAALRLIRDPLFLFRVVQKVREMGVIGEKLNLLVLFLAGLTKNFDKPVSVLEKGVSSTGKSEVVKAVIALFPPECVLERASLSKMAPAHGALQLDGKILYVVEYRGAKDALYLTRLLQSEGQVTHEYATAIGRARGTVTATRTGSPVVFTTTTLDRVFEDDETRFVSLQADDSPAQTRDVIAANFDPTPARPQEAPLSVWHEAVRMLCTTRIQFRHPAWFSLLANEIPPDEPRARRDAAHFLSLLKAVALCRSHSDGRIKESGKEVEVNFADYCVAHRILSRAFASTFAGQHPRTLELANAVRTLSKELEKPVSVKEVASHLGWDQPVTYKYAKAAVKNRLVCFEPGFHLHNQKSLLPGAISQAGFLPDPNLIFQDCKEIGDEVQYVDPLNGKHMVRRRRMETE